LIERQKIVFKPGDLIDLVSTYAGLKEAMISLQLGPAVAIFVDSTSMGIPGLS
jgi:hypothetical protein